MDIAFQSADSKGYNNQYIYDVIGQDNLPLMRTNPYADNDRNGDYGVALEELMANWSLLQMYGTHAFESENCAGVAPRMTLPERLAATLLELACGQNGRIQDMSLQALADYLGTSRETVGAILRAFRRQGLIELGYRYIQVLDVGSLEELGSVPAYA